MTRDEEDAIVAEAWAFYGPSAQLAQTQEEAAELIVAISHLRRGRDGIVPVIEEAADLLIMLRQVELAYGPELREVVRRKLIRLKGRISEAKEAGKR